MASEKQEASTPRPSQIGRYRVLDLLGEGGMGIVYLAEQSEPVSRRVALKLVRASLLSPQTSARFAVEQQALARLSHPAIAQLYEAGTTDDGCPFFAMELVEGEPLTRYCDSRRLSIEGRLELFVAVCEGVQHAHRRGVLHRDLKPSNILVHDGKAAPQVKIIDFGIAKALDEPLHETRLTVGGIMGTPTYMSPESLGGDGGALDLDTRTDVYSLGILLGELLCGLTPSSAAGEGLAGFINRLTVEQTPTPGQRLRAETPQKQENLALDRGLTATALERRLVGDLNWIVARATARDREERYGSATELAADVERHLAHLPVAAGPPSASYRLRKFVRRHRSGVAMGLLLALAVIVGVVGTSVGLVRAQRAETEALVQADVARTEAESARQVADFLVEIFETSDPTESEGETVTARELLDRGTEKIEQELAKLVYWKLGRLDEAAPLFRRATEIRQRQLAPGHPHRATSLWGLANVYRDQGRLSEAEALYRQALEIRQKALPEGHPELEDAYRELAVLLRRTGQVEEAQALEGQL